MRCVKHILFIFLTVNVAGCAIGALRVNSTPDKAEVFLAYEGEQPTKIGETPLNMDSRLIDKNRGRYLTVLLKKEGFQTESVLVPVSALQTSLDISSRLDEFKLPLQCQDSGFALNKIAKGIADVQGMLKANQLNEAQMTLNILIGEYPKVSVLHDLLGNVHYLNKNLEGALAAYQKSINLEPNNSDTQRMVSKIRSILGVRAPSGSEGR